MELKRRIDSQFTVNLLNYRSDSLIRRFAHIDRQPNLAFETSVSILYQSLSTGSPSHTVSHITKTLHLTRSQQG